jgi:preprotein translocase subunit YajC
MKYIFYLAPLIIIIIFFNPFRGGLLSERSNLMVNYDELDSSDTLSRLRPENLINKNNKKIQQMDSSQSLSIIEQVGVKMRSHDFIFKATWGMFILIFWLMLIFIFKSIRKRKLEIKELKKYGRVIMAKVDGVDTVSDFNGDIHSSRSRFLVVKASYKDNFDGKLYHFISDERPTLPNPLPLEVRVYVDKKDPNKYYVDLGEFSFISIKKY